MADISSITLPGGGTYDLKDKNAVPKYGMGKNLLRNWYFVGGGTGRGIFPVNQRGQSSYSRNSYSIDGWFVNNTTNFGVSLTNSSLTLTSSSYTGVFLEYIPHLQFGKQYTFSVLFSNGSMVATTGKISDSSEYIRVAFSGGAIVVWYDQVQIQCFGGNSFSVIAAKLELGPEQTLAHQENGIWILNETPDYEYELYRCITSTADPYDTYANKSLATEQQLAYVETGNIATRNYTAGQYICWNGLTYTANQAISSGATLSADTGGNLTECVGGGFNQFAPSGPNFYTIPSGGGFEGPTASNLWWISIGKVVFVNIKAKKIGPSASFISGFPPPPGVVLANYQDLIVQVLRSGELYLYQGTNNTTYEFSITYISK